jgi:hypothetical protein
MYPYTYDNINTIDLAQCSIYSHTLTDGFLGDFYEFSLGTLQKIFVKYGTSLAPKLDLIKYDESYILKGLTGVKFNATESYSFDIFLDDLGEISSEGIIWQDGSYMLKLYSDDSDLVYYKPIKLIRETETQSTKADITELKDMISSESKEIQSDIDYIPSQNTTAKIRM